MNVITSAEAAKLWNVSQRRVQAYCKEGQIKGARMLGDRWFVPKNATKPEKKWGDREKVQIKGQVKCENLTMRFVDFDIVKNDLSEV